MCECPKPMDSTKQFKHCSDCPELHKKQHKWAKEIKAWADGAQIQWKHDTLGWIDCASNSPNWPPVMEYRIKPQLKPDLVRYGKFNFSYNPRTDCIIGTPYVKEIFNVAHQGTNFKVTFADDGNGEYKLKSMEVL